MTFNSNSDAIVDDVLLSAIGETSPSRQVRCLVDTGAALNLFDEKMLREIGADPVTTEVVEITTLRGPLTVVRYSVKLKPGLSDFQFLESYGVADWPYEEFQGILGRPFLRFCDIVEFHDETLRVRVDDDKWSIGISDAAAEEMRPT